MSGAQIGQPGKKYGLVLPKKPSQQTRARPAPPKRLPGAAFSLDDDDDDDEEQNDMAIKQSFNAMLQQRSARAQKQFEEAQKAALNEDPSIYDYDGAYDAMQEERGERERQAKAQAQEEKKSSKYIESLKRAAELKKQEQDRYFERRLAKERKDEDELYKDKDVFVTSAYKKKLMEMKKWDVIDKLEEEAEKRQEKKGMDAFFSNLMNNNIAMGADVKKAAKSAYTVGSVTSEKVMAREMTVVGEAGRKEKEKKQKEEEEKERERERAAEPPAGPSSRMVDDRKRPRDDAATGGGGAEAREREGTVKEEQKEKGGEKRSKPLPPKEEEKPPAEPVVDPEEVKRQKEEAIKKARERFLARKKGGGSS